MLRSASQHATNTFKMHASARFMTTQLGSGQAGGLQDSLAYSAFFALRAFYVELATVQEAVSNPMIGKMRMQFWRDAVKSVSDGNPSKHPIALALYDATQKVKLPSYHLKRIIDARDAELYTPTHMTLDSLLAHAESTSSTFNYLLLSMLSLSSSEQLSHAASHLGVSQTIGTLLRSLPYHAKSGRMVIPAEITAKHGVNQEEVFRYGGEAKGVDDAVFEFATSRIVRDRCSCPRYRTRCTSSVLNR
ncbi:unnamed protein product [Somion occarium]|uniref:Phytoene synthase n=1 Tax=Somion occarium TaxID=3059160 RepID=A0ABP1DZF6_9APHY